MKRVKALLRQGALQDEADRYYRQFGKQEQSEEYLLAMTQLLGKVSAVALNELTLDNAIQMLPLGVRERYDVLKHKCECEDDHWLVIYYLLGKSEMSKILSTEMVTYPLDHKGDVVPDSLERATTQLQRQMHRRRFMQKFHPYMRGAHN